MDDLRPRRSLLYLPANRAGAVAKARTLDCDCVILDLEDAVAPEAKDGARDAAVAALLGGGWEHRELLIRVNGLETSWAASDFAAARAAGASAIVVPKISGVEQARAAVELAAGLPIWAMIETPRAVIDAADIAATQGITALVAGFADLAADLSARPEHGRIALHYSMSAIVIAARAAGILAFDGVFPDIADDAGLEIEAQQGLTFGFDGKTLIHPSQVDIVNKVFAPTVAELDDARCIITAYEAARCEGIGVATYRGKLVELLHVATARRRLAIAAAITAR